MVGSFSRLAHSQLPFSRDRVSATHAADPLAVWPACGAWLAAAPTDPGATLPPAHMHVALRRRLRLALPLTHRHCGGDGFPGCGAVLDVLHAAACPRSGLLARRAPLLGLAWARVAREGFGPEGRVVPRQSLANTSAPGVSAQDRRRLGLVLYGATRLGEALCCDATLVAPLRRGGRPQPRAAEEDGRSHCGSAAPQGGGVPGASPAWPAAAGRSCL